MALGDLPAERGTVRLIALLAGAFPVTVNARRRGGSHGSFLDSIDSYVLWTIAGFAAIVIALKLLALVRRPSAERRSRVEATRRRGR
jgi:hypothetical protein